MGDLRKRLDELKVSARSHALRPTWQPAQQLRDLAELVGGSERRCTGVPYWQVETDFHQACDRHGFAVPAHTAALLDRQPDRVASLDPARTIVLDIETGGFAGTEVFLIGFVRLDRRPLQVVQWLARDYPEEAGILRALAAIADQRDTWVTFNGKSFDEPFLRDRAAVHHVAFRPPAVHVDLLHHARRHWRGDLPDCKLQTLEQHLLGWQRVGDVPGSDIPDLFHHFMRTGNAAPLRPVLEHNQLDLISCTELLLRTA